MASTTHSALPVSAEQEWIVPEMASTGLRTKIASLIELTVNGRYFGLPLADWVCSGLLGLVATSWVYRASHELLLVGPFLFFGFFLAMAAAGRLIFFFLRLSSFIEVSYPTAVVCGFLPVGLIFSILRVVTEINFTLLSVLLVLILFVGLWRYRREVEWLHPDSSTTAMGIIVTVLLAVSITTRVAFFCFPGLLQDGNELVIKMGDNEFYHAGFITFLDSPGPSWEFGSQHLAGRLAFFYHFASYIGGAWLRSMTGIASIDALFGFMTPLGLMLAAMAAYSLASTWFTPRISFWGIVIFFGLPDLALLSGLTPIQQSMYASPLLVLPATPANGYGLASSLIAIFLVTVGLQRNRSELIGFGLTVAVSTVLWKAQLAVNVCLALGVLLLPHFIRLLRLQVLMPPLAMLVLIYFVSRNFFDTSRTPTAFLDPTWGAHLAEWHLSTLPKTSAITHLGPVALQDSIPAFFARILLNALASFGPLAIAWIAVSLYSVIKARRVSLPIAATFCSVFVFLTLGALLAENRTGFRFEMQYSPYFLPMLLMELVVVDAVARSRLFHFIRKKPIPLALGFYATIPIYLLSTLVPQDRTLGMPFPEPLAKCASYIHSVSDPYDIVQDSAGDPSALLTGMTERRTFVGLLAFKNFIGMVDLVKMYEERIALNKRLIAAKSKREILDLRAECPIRWYVMWPDVKPAWPESMLSSPVFQSDGFRVYDLDKLSEHQE